MLPTGGEAAVTAQEMITLVQQQLAVPSEIALGEMRVYRGEQLNRTYSFVIGKLWQPETQTESVRMDFQTAINSLADSGSLYGDHRYLLRRAGQTPPAQWLYLPALRRVRTVPYQPDDRVLQSDSLFYDLTAIRSLDDYEYRLVDDDEQHPTIEGMPHNPLVPYQRILLQLEKRGETYLVLGITSLTGGKEKHARMSTFTEIVPGRFRPRQVVVTGESGRTEFTFLQWVVRSPEFQFFTPSSLETKKLMIPRDEREQ
jgi:hypothetical protein